MSTEPRFGPIDPETVIGHVHLKVADIDRSLTFYCGVLGFVLQSRMGDEAAFVSAGGYHHHIGINTWESKGGAPPPPGTTGLFHVAIRYPTRAALGDALRRLGQAGIRLDGASDHGVSEALYLHDPDQNGVELYRDKAREEWPTSADGHLKMRRDRLDLEALAASLAGRALQAGLWSLETIDLRAFGIGRHRAVDDTPAGGGLLSVPLSVGFRRLGSPQHPALRCPDFPRAQSRERAVTRPAS